MAGIIVSGAADAENNIVVVPGTNGMLTQAMVIIGDIFSCLRYLLEYGINSIYSRMYLCTPSTRHTCIVRLVAVVK